MSQRSVTQIESPVKGVDLTDQILTPHQQALDEFYCDHPETEIRYKVIANGTKQYKEQCLTCGRATTNNAIAHSKIPDIESVREWDQALENNYMFQVQERAGEIRLERQQQWENRQTEWDEWYREYTSSPEWKDKRRRVLKRDNYQCKACEQRKATEVHHLTYKHAGNEPLFDLVSVCAVCHKKLTALDGRGGHDE